MVTVPPKSPFLEEHKIPTEGSDLLHAKLMRPRPPIFPKRLVFISPLVGAGAAQGLILFRSLSRRGSILMSFAYRGHPRSTGTFELDKTIVDTRHALAWACSYAHEHGLPLHAFATCYGVIPLIAQFTGAGPHCRLWSISSISGLFRLDHILRFEDFAPVFSRHLGRQLDTEALLAGIAQRAFDFSGDAFRHALREYLTGLFPGLRVGRDYFEELRYDRAHVPKTLLQLARAPYLDGLTVPRRIACRFFFGRNDDVLALQTREARQAYRDRVLSLIPHAEVQGMEFDHFGRGPDHDAVLGKLGDFFEECEMRRVFPDRTDETSPLQDIRR